MTEILNERLLTAAEVAAVFRISPVTVARWANTGRFAEVDIRVVRTIGGHLRFVAADLERYMSDGGQP